MRRCVVADVCPDFCPDVGLIRMGIITSISVATATFRRTMFYFSSIIMLWGEIFSANMVTV